jgi:endoglycosylceramidase
MGVPGLAGQTTQQGEKTMKKLVAFCAIAGLVACIGCGPKQEEPALSTESPAKATVQESQPKPAQPTAKFVSVKGDKFLDPEGRHLILHGAAVISKSPAENYQSWHGPEDFALMRQWGMNCIRLGIIWDGLEPEPGKYDEEYLKKVDQRIAWAKENDLYVFLDMHQDLFSVLYSDGAPEWATLHDGLPHNTPGAVWSDAYLTSGAVQRSFDNFWANKPCADGVGVQDHYALAWKHVAARYADEPTVIAYDLMNEPSLGSAFIAAQGMMVDAFAKAIAEKDGEGAPSADEIVGQWMSPEGRSALMKRLCDIDLYKQVMAGPEPIFMEFERTQVTAMHQRVTNAIREVDTNHIIFLETSMSANMGIYSGIEPVNGPDGNREPQQAYAPHGYDIVVDTADLTLGCDARVELIFARHGETAKRLAMPMLIGEWGAFGNAGEAIIPSARFVVTQFEKLLCSDTYWNFGRNLQDTSYFHVLNRAIPVQIAGTLTSYRNDFEAGTFSCTWKEDPAITQPSRIYVPARLFKGPEGVKLTPEGSKFTVEPAAEGAEDVVLVIAPMGDDSERTLSLGQ